MSAREEFEKLDVCNCLDLTVDVDAWGAQKYKHSHIQRLYEGFQEGLEAAAKHVEGNLNLCSPDHPDIATTIEICADAIRKLKE